MTSIRLVVVLQPCLLSHAGRAKPAGPRRYQAMHNTAMLTGSRMFRDVQLAQAKRCGAWQLPQSSRFRENKQKGVETTCHPAQTQRAEVRRCPESWRRVLCFLHTVSDQPEDSEHSPVPGSGPSVGGHMLSSRSRPPCESPHPMPHALAHLWDNPPTTTVAAAHPHLPLQHAAARP